MTFVDNRPETTPVGVVTELDPSQTVFINGDFKKDLLAVYDATGMRDAGGDGVSYPGLRLGVNSINPESFSPFKEGGEPANVDMSIYRLGLGDFRSIGVSFGYYRSQVPIAPLTYGRTESFSPVVHALFTPVTRRVMKVTIGGEGLVYSDGVERSELAGFAGRTLAMAMERGHTRGIHVLASDFLLKAFSADFMDH